MELLRQRSPLVYNRGAEVHRLAVRDSDAPPSSDQTYFAPTIKRVRAKAGGWKDGPAVPGAGDPHVVAFLDYHYVPYSPEPIPTVDFAKTREDMRRRGYVKRLLDTFLLEHESAPWIEFGDVYHDDMWNYLRKRQAEGFKIYGRPR